MIAQGRGVIINNSSGCGIVGGDKAVAYCASKGGVVLLTKAMAIDHGRQTIELGRQMVGQQSMLSYHSLNRLDRSLLLQGRIAALQLFGYDAEESRFLCIAALHSGYFLRRQFLLPARSPKPFVKDQSRKPDPFRTRQRRSQ